MALQLIFVVEANPRAKTDWVYIKETIDCFYEYDNATIKLTPIYMDGKDKYLSKKSEVNGKIKDFRKSSSDNKTEVIYCFDCDNFDKKIEDQEFLQKAEKYCKENGYHFVWFCRDIEDVYIGKQIAKTEKKQEAIKFKKNKVIWQISEKNLQAIEMSIKKSNLMRVLNNLLKRK